jgi:hypothetical protein
VTFQFELEGRTWKAGAQEVEYGGTAAKNCLTTRLLIRYVRGIWRSNVRSVS